MPRTARKVRLLDPWVLLLATVLLAPAPSLAATSAGSSLATPPATTTAGSSPATSPAAPPASAPCACATALVTNGWCERHEVGYVAGVVIKSKMLYETLDAHGHVLDLTTFVCPMCRKAIETDGFCEDHKIGFVAKQAYFSRLTYELARGKPVDPAMIPCAACRSNTKSHGWCEKHKVGMAGRVAITDHDAYLRTLKAIGILEIANKMAARCEGCAVAIVTNSFCPNHRIRYRDGKALTPG